jgi:carboxymethylenebutenolidase
LTAAAAAAACLAGNAAAQQPPPAARGPADPRLQIDAITLSTPRQPMPVELTRLRFPGRRSAVLLLPERLGPTPGFAAIARRLALDGLLVAVPDLPSSWGVAQGATADRRDAFNRAPLDALTALVLSVADHVQRMPECNGVLELVAFQWGASLSLPLLQQPGRVRAAVLFDIIADRSDRWLNVLAPLQLHVAENDQGAASNAEALEKRMLASGHDFERYVYPGLSGGFALESSEKTYDRGAAELAFERMARFLKRRA